MHRTLILLGLGKVAFGVVVGVLGIFIGMRLVARTLRERRSDEELAQGNVAVGIFEAASLLSLGLSVQHAVTATFDAMDLLYRGQPMEGRMIGRFLVFAAFHVGISMLIGSAVIVFGVWLFGKLTRGVDELGEIRKGNVAPALTVAAVIVVLSLTTAPGLHSVLDGMLPLPELGRDAVRMSV
jgi:uncharacterized membrane protein YjfL (UPF0719 family)